MKKIISSILSFALVISFASCGTNSANPSESTTTASKSEQTAGETLPETTADTTTDKAEDGSTSDSETENISDSSKVLVVYFSASGNTERVAKDIAAAAGADLFEVIPEEIYTDEDLNWSNSDSRVCSEHDDESLRDIPLTAATVENWESYDTVFIGYPIWWAIAAWPINGFVKNNDFSGKTVIPFATSASSPIGQSGELLAEMAGTGDWRNGQRFSSGASADDVQNWVNGLGL